jgi:hypothetical protein
LVGDVDLFFILAVVEGELVAFELDHGVIRDS